eukprot:UC4_evm2s357
MVSVPLASEVIALKIKSCAKDCAEIIKQDESSEFNNIVGIEEAQECVKGIAALLENELLQLMTVPTPSDDKSSTKDAENSNKACNANNSLYSEPLLDSASQRRMASSISETPADVEEHEPLQGPPSPLLKSGVMDMPWFHGKIGRDNAADLVLRWSDRSCPDPGYGYGGFLLRISPSNGQLVLTVNCSKDHGVKHMRMMISQSECRLANTSVRTVGEMIKHFSKIPLPIKKAKGRSRPSDGASVRLRYGVPANEDERVPISSFEEKEEEEPHPTMIVPRFRVTGEEQNPYATLASMAL